MQLHHSYIDIFEKKFDLSFPVDFVPRFLEQKKSQPYTSSVNLVRIFDIQTWIMLLISMGSTTVCFLFITKIFKKVFQNLFLLF